jgi:hypothetical protein
MVSKHVVVKFATRTVLALSFFALVIPASACSGRIQPGDAAARDVGAEMDGGAAAAEGDARMDVEGSPTDTAAEATDADGAVASSEDAALPDGCVKPENSAICRLAPGQVSSSFDPVACGVAGNAEACRALCRAWTVVPSIGADTSCLPGEAYGGPPGSFVCQCNIA